MSEQKATLPFKLGDWVKIRLSGFKQGRIVELRGPLGPGGAQIYRVRVRRKPTPMDIEVREDQLILAPPEERPARARKPRSAKPSLSPPSSTSSGGDTDQPPQTAHELPMPDKDAPRPLKLGDLVKIRHSGFKRARIIELRGPLGPGGAQVYRVRVRRKPTPLDIEVLGEQLILLPPEE
jgi:hypothetical protein